MYEGCSGEWHEVLTEGVSLILELLLPVIVKNRLPDSIAISPTSSALAGARLLALGLCAWDCRACCCCCCSRARLGLHTDAACGCGSSSGCSSCSLGCSCGLQSPVTNKAKIYVEM